MGRADLNLRRVSAALQAGHRQLHQLDDWDAVFDDIAADRLDALLVLALNAVERRSRMWFASQCR